MKNLFQRNICSGKSYSSDSYLTSYRLRLYGYLYFASTFDTRGLIAWFRLKFQRGTFLYIYPLLMFVFAFVVFCVIVYVTSKLKIDKVLFG